MQKLAKVGSVIVDVGEWYQANDMSEATFHPIYASS